jgi:hypothetical protein
MSFSDSEIYTKKIKYPAEVQKAQEEVAFNKEMEVNNAFDRTDSSDSSATITQSMFCNNNNCQSGLIKIQIMF